MTAPTPTFEGIPAELRNNIYEYVAADTTSRTISGWHLLKSSRKKEYDGDLEKQLLSASIMHPLSLTCHTTYTEFPLILKTTTPPADEPILYLEFVVNNIDFKQLELFQRYVKEHCTSSDKKTPAQRKKITLQFLVNSDFVRVAQRLIENRAMWYEFNRLGFACSNFSVLFKHGKYASASVAHENTMTVAQVVKANELLARVKQSCKGMLGQSFSDDGDRVTLGKLIHRFQKMSEFYAKKSFFKVP